jgi:hypothetical protein
MNTKHPKRPADFNQRAHQVFLEAVGEAAPVPAETPVEADAEPVIPIKNPHAVALGKLGGSKGGKARAAKMTPEQRADQALRAARARWEKENREKGA